MFTRTIAALLVKGRLDISGTAPGSFLCVYRSIDNDIAQQLACGYQHGDEDK